MAGKITTAVEIEIGVTGDGSVKSIKTQLREAKEEAIQLAQKFGENSKEATAAAQRVAKLRDTMEDFGQKVKALNPDKLQRIATLGSGIAQGFVAAQGAMALFGSESEELNKTMIKLQGAIALSQGLQGLKDTIKAFSSLNPIVLGIVAVVGALAFGIKKLMDAEQLESDQLKKIHEDKLRIYKEQQEAAEHLYQTERKAITRKLDDRSKEVDTQIANQERYAAILNDGIQKELLLQNAAHVRRLSAAIDNGEDLKLVEQQNQKEINDIYAKYAKIRFDKAQADIIARDKFITDNDKRTADERAAWNKTQNDLALAEEKRLLDEVARLQAKADADQRQREANEVQSAREMQRLKQDAILTGLNALSDIVVAFAGKSEAAQKRAFEVQKAFNIATTIIDTYFNANAAYKSQLAIPTPDAPVRAAIAAGVAIASGLARLAKIKATEFNSTSAPTISTPTQAPNINQSIPQQRQIIGNTTGATGQQTQTNQVKVYVVENEINAVKERRQTIERRARIK